MNSPTIHEALLMGHKYLKKSNTNYQNETLWIMQKSLKINLKYILLNKFKSINNSKYKLFLKLIKRRAKKEPLQHILNSVSFYGYDFNIEKDVFIPRPETELFVEILKNHVGYRNKVLEIGTGSGCIPIVLELENLSDDIISIDINHKALDLARSNAKKFNCSKINFLYTDLFSFNTNIQYDLIISNPPYIPITDIELLDNEVKLYDPLDALTDYKDGLRFYKYFADFAEKYLCKSGYMLFEFGGRNQIEDLKVIFSNTNYSYVFFNDLNNEPRFILISKL